MLDIVIITVPLCRALLAHSSFPGLPGHSLQSTPFPLPNLAEREGRKACGSRGLLGGTVAESMKASPVGDCFQSLVGRNSSFQIVRMNYHYMLRIWQLGSVLHIVFQDLSHSRMVSGDLPRIRAMSFVLVFAAASRVASSIAACRRARFCRVFSFRMMLLAM